MIKTTIGIITAILLAGCSAQKFTVLAKKGIGKGFIKITDSLYAQQTEVTNYEYMTFLWALSDSGKDSLLKICSIDSTGWRMRDLFNEPLVPYYHLNPGYNYYPVVNISFEAAQQYCTWLTEKYNNNPARKYKKVVFRLPSEEEWKMAARGTVKQATFPWEGLSLYDEEKNWRAKFWEIPQEQIYGDTMINNHRFVIASKTRGYTDVPNNLGRPAAVKSYSPNSLGLYDMAGNVSEMLDGKGKTKGGSWFSTGYYLRIDAPDEFDGQMMEPSPLVGFRVFAEIVEN